MAKLKSEPKSQLDRIASIHPRYEQLLRRQAALIERRDALQAELNDGYPQRFRIERTDVGEKITHIPGKVSLAETARRAVLSWVMQTPKPKPAPIKRHEGAVELLGDLLPEPAPEELNPPPLPPNFPDEPRYKAIGAELGSITEALRLLAPLLVAARKEYSKLVAAQRGAEYSELVGRAVDVARALGESVLEIYAFLDQARLDGVERRWLRPVNLEMLGDLGEGSPLQQLIAHAVELGHVGAGKKPDWKMPANIQLLS